MIRPVCPICGGEPVMETREWWQTGEGGTGVCWVMCHDCGLCSEPQAGGTPEENNDAAMYDWIETVHNIKSKIRKGGKA